MHQKDNPENFSIFYANVCSIRNKTGEIEATIYARQRYNMLCFTEHCMLQEEIEHLKVLDYSVVSSFCRENSKHGGSAILCGPAWETKTLGQLTDLSVEHECEVSAIEITKLDLVVVTIYRPPGGNFSILLDVINSILNVSLGLKKYVILNGDFNIHFEKNYNLKEQFLDLTESYDFREKVLVNTRKNHRLDNVFINFEDVCDCQITVFNPDLSDHDGAIECIINIENLVKNFKKNYDLNLKKLFCRPFTKNGITKMSQLLHNENWTFLETNKAEVSCTQFFESFFSYRGEAFPEVKRGLTPNREPGAAEWFNGELQATRWELHVLNEMLAETDCPVLRRERNALRNKYRLEINTSKKLTNSNYIRNSDNIAKASWHLIKKHMPTTNTKTKVNLSPNLCNNYFAEVAENLVRAMPTAKASPALYLRGVRLGGDNLAFSFGEVTPCDVYQALNTLKKKHSKDFYDLSVVQVQTFSELLCVPLATIFNKCIREGIYPKEFKISRTIPIFKGGDRSLPSNYRPISLIPVFSKIFELILKNQLCPYLEGNGLFVEEQWGFRKNRSTTGAILNLCDFIVGGFEEGEIVASTFSDLSKAFDCVSHDILIEKLKYYGLDDMSIKLMSDYLGNRVQVTEIEGERSEERAMRHGVPQGSILGPLLFLVYINDLPNALPDCRVVMFADDSGFSVRAGTLEDANAGMTVHVESANDWFRCNYLNVNLNKTETMIFSLKKCDIPDNPEKLKFLGVTLDSRLTFDQHVTVISKKLCSAIYVLRNIAKIVDKETTLMAYHGLFHSICSYGLLAWGHSSHASRVFALQRRAIRVIAGIGYRDDAKPFFESLKILTLPSQYILEALIFYRKNSQNYLTNAEVHNYNTRNRNDIQIEFLRLNTSWNATRHYAPAFFNKLPHRIRNLPLIAFKRKIKQFLMSSALYSINEFLELNMSDMEF